MPNTVLFINSKIEDLIFHAPATNPFGLTDVGTYASPTFADIDKDGDLDAFVGNWSGDTLFYLNTGTASSAVFSSPSTNPFGLTTVGKYATPIFADINNDGDLDAFIGNKAGNIEFFRNTGSAESAVFAEPVLNPFGLSNFGHNANLALADIDGDGDFDAFIGEKYGNMLFFKNTGTANKAAFAAPVTEPFGLTDVGWFASPSFVDIDGDGDLDALVGANAEGDILLYSNTGTASNPVFASAVTNPFGLTAVGFAHPAFVDINDDGDLDAFIGNSAGNTLFFQNDIKPSATNLDAAESYTEDNGEVNLTDIVITDVDSSSVTVTLTLSNIDAGSLSIATSGTASSTYNAGVWTASGTVASVNTLLAGLVFTPSSNFNGNFTIAVTVSDDTTTLTGSKSFTGTAVNDDPTGTVTIIGIVQQAEILTAYNTLDDADGMGDISYQWKVGDGVNPYVNIIGATGNTYQIKKAELDKHITVAVSYTDAQGNVNTATSAATAAVAKNFSPLSIDGTPGADTLEGASGNDTINGLAENDVINGYGGGDSLYGDNGSDTLYGGNGKDILMGGIDDLAADTLIGGNGGDTYFVGFDTSKLVNDIVDDQGTDTAIDTVIIPFQVSSYILAAGIENAELAAGTQAGSLTGNELNNTLTGNAGNNILIGGAGNDTYEGGAGIDTVKYTSAAMSIVVDLALATASGTEIGIDTFEGIENITGGQADDILTGNAADNRLKSGAGNDILEGGAGNDTLKGGAGNDVLSDSAGNDTLNGGADIDTASYENFVETISIDLAITTAQFVSAFAGTDTLLNIENLLGGSGDDILKGDINANTIRGGAGNDTLAGGGGGLDVLAGGGGNDILKGGAGNGTLKGGAGDDILIGGAGLDVLIGGAEADSFRLNSLSDVDTISDFSVDDDRIELKNDVFKQLTSGADNYGSGYIIYDSSTGFLFYDADGNSAVNVAAVPIVQLTAGLLLTNDDFFVI